MSLFGSGGFATDLKNEAFEANLKIELLEEFREQSELDLLLVSEVSLAQGWWDGSMTVVTGSAATQNVMLSSYRTPSTESRKSLNVKNGIAS